MEHPFTEQELFEVYRLLVRESEARALARASVSPDLSDLAEPTEHRGPGLKYRAIPHVDLTFDTLVLLSLLSEEMNSKVERYLEAVQGDRPMAPDFRARWERRRAELEAWADAGYPTEE